MLCAVAFIRIIFASSLLPFSILLALPPSLPPPLFCSLAVRTRGFFFSLRYVVLFRYIAASQLLRIQNLDSGHIAHLPTHLPR